MQKRPCGKTGLDFTVIGFGGMRIHGGDAKQWADLVRQAAEAGFNYFETSHRYCGSTSEAKIGEGLKGFPREKVIISTKSSADDFLTADAVRKVIDESLAKLQVDYLDFYQLWSLPLKDFTEIAIKPGGTLEGIRKAMDEGLIRHLGFTSHDSPENMIALLRTGEFEAVTLQYNLLNRVNEPVIAEAGRLGIGVIVMGPLHGGILATPTPVLERIMGTSGCSRIQGQGAAAEAAFRFILSNPNVTCAISGMTRVRRRRHQSRIAENVTPLTAAEMAAVDEELKRFKTVVGLAVHRLPVLHAVPAGRRHLRRPRPRKRLARVRPRARRAGGVREVRQDMAVRQLQERDLLHGVRRVHWKVPAENRHSD